MSWKDNDEGGNMRKVSESDSSSHSGTESDMSKDFLKQLSELQKAVKEFSAAHKSMERIIMRISNELESSRSDPQQEIEGILKKVEKLGKGIEDNRSRLKNSLISLSRSLTNSMKTSNEEIKESVMKSFNSQERFMKSKLTSFKLEINKNLRSLTSTVNKKLKGMGQTFESDSTNSATKQIEAYQKIDNSINIFKGEAVRLFKKSEKEMENISDALTDVKDEVSHYSELCSTKMSEEFQSGIEGSRKWIVQAILNRFQKQESMMEKDREGYLETLRSVVEGKIQRSFESKMKGMERYLNDEFRKVEENVDKKIEETKDFVKGHESQKMISMMMFTIILLVIIILCMVMFYVKIRTGQHQLLSSFKAVIQEERRKFEYTRSINKDDHEEEDDEYTDIDDEESCTTKKSIQFIPIEFIDGKAEKFLEPLRYELSSRFDFLSQDLQHSDEEENILIVVAQANRDDGVVEKNQIEEILRNRGRPVGKLMVVEFSHSENCETKNAAGKGWKKYFEIDGVSDLGSNYVFTEVLFRGEMKFDKSVCHNKFVLKKIESFFS